MCIIMEVKNKLKEGNSIPLMSEEELKYTQKPIGKAIYKRAIGRPKKPDNEKARPGDRVICEICGGNFKRSHRSAHNKTKIHKVYEDMNKKLVNLLINK
ncbi:MAG TPA: hypothetical protein VLZ83_14075 [Edaphocola sp.]|nr:hypothetical protein [Edaphocola sp.]